MMRHALGVLFACAGALALDEAAASDVSVSARLVLATDFDAATFNADWYARVPLRRALARLVSDEARGVCVQWWQDWEDCVADPVAVPDGAGHAVDVTVRARAAGAVSDDEAERRYLTFVRDRATAAAADGSLDATIRATAREVGDALGERGVEIWQRDAAAVDGAASRAALARAEVGVRRLLVPQNTPRAPVAASYSYSYSYSYDIIYDVSYSYDIIYDVSYSYSFETMAPTPAAVAAVSLNMGYTMAPLSASKSPAWVDFWASETYYGYMGDEEEMTTHAHTMVSVAFGADSVFGEVTTDSVGATIVIAEGPNPCVLGTSSSREEYDGCLETNGISGRRLDERERATPARASRRLIVASDDDIDEVCGPSCNVDDGSVTDDASKLVVGMEIETDLEAEEISAGVGAATDSVVAAATADCSCSETDCNALACAFCDASGDAAAEGCEEAFVVSDVAVAYTVVFSNDTNVTTYEVISGSATFSGISYDEANDASAKAVFRDAIGRLSANITENRVSLTRVAASARRRLSDGVVVDFEISVTAAEMAAVEEDLQAAKNDPSLLDAALTAAAAASADATMTALFANIKTESFAPDIGSTPAPTTLGFFNLFYQACVTGGDTYPLGRRFSNLYCQAVAPEFAAHEEEHGPMGTPNAPQPSPRPTPAPVVQPPGAGVPTYRPTPAPVVQPPGAGIPTYMPSSSPTFVPTKVPISAPTYVPTPAPITPSYKPTTAR